MDYRSILLLLSLIVSKHIFSQDSSFFRKDWFMQNGDTLPYRILLPENYDASNKYPLVIFLHGRGESGDDNEKQLLNGSSLFLADSNRKRFPAIVVFPQCARNSYWSNNIAIMEGKKPSHRTLYFLAEGEASSAMKLLLSFVDNFLMRYPVEKKQVYVMGLSMGGMGVFELVRRKPNVFAAAAPICGGANPQTAAKLTGTKWWIFHGAKDDVVLPSFSEGMYKALKAANGSAKFTLYPEANHNSWDSAFAEPGLLKWLFSQKLSGR